MNSDPTKQDSDGDGAVDLEDATPTRYNDKLSYIFTEYNDKENALIKESKLREFNISKNKGEKVTLYYTISSKDFKDKWDGMGLNSSGKKEFIINEVHLVYHGGPQTINIAANYKLCTSDKTTVNPYNDIIVSNLNPKSIVLLNISSCNGGNLDYNSDNGKAMFTDNLALTFLKSCNHIDTITAWDGYAYFTFKEVEELGYVVKEYSKTGKGFDTWSECVNGFFRKAEQRIVYRKDKNGKILITPNQKRERGHNEKDDNSTFILYSITSIDDFRDFINSNT